MLFKKKSKIEEEKKTIKEENTVEIEEEHEQKDEEIEEEELSDIFGDFGEFGDFEEAEDELEETDDDDELSDKIEQDEEETALTEFQDTLEEEINASEIDLNREMVLYVITDKDKNETLRFMRECSLKVDRIFDDILEAKNSLLILDLPCRVVIIDSGTGKFAGLNVRREIVDMLGISGEDNKVTVFYTDSSIKSDTMSILGKKHKGIEWHNYESTTVVVAVILKYAENYIYDYNDEIEDIDELDILDTKGLKDNDITFDKLFSSNFDPEEFLDSLENESEEQIDSFDIEI